MIEKIFNGIEHEVIQERYDGSYNKIEYDSRRIQEGDIFVALVGEMNDGHDYIDYAIRNGAKLIVISKEAAVRNEEINIFRVENTRKVLGRIASNFYDGPEKKLKILGVTGTNGKTTTAYILHTLLEDSAFIGSIGIETGGGIYPPVNTTPESLDIIRYAKEALGNGKKYLVLEVSSQGIDNFRVEGLEFAGGIFTNLTREHLDYHRDMEEYYSVKEGMFRQLRDDGIIVTSIEDEYGRWIKERYKDALTYGYNSGDYRGKVLKLDLNLMKVRVDGPKGSFTLETSLIGEYNLLNIMAAIAMVEGLCEGDEALPERLKRISFVEGRMHIVEEEGIRVIVDYAHTEDALEKVLKTLVKCRGRKLYTLISGTGERYAEKRPGLAEIAERYSDHVMVSSNSPRHEDPMKIALEVAKGFKGLMSCSYEIEIERASAVKKLIHRAQEGDIILLTGKGHESYQEIRGVKNKYKEIEVVKEALMELKIVRGIDFSGKLFNKK